jgi:hypothetical protein
MVAMTVTRGCGQDHQEFQIRNNVNMTPMAIRTVVRKSMVFMVKTSLSEGFFC